MRNGKERTAFKEVAFAEYNKGQANWRDPSPRTMINKVAVSQCVRDAFPKDYEGSLLRGRDGRLRRYPGGIQGAG